jgi:predicted TIM-barrel fold metal-dependent hydrolase
MAQGAAKAEFPQFERNTRTPTRRAPAGSWDCQVHVFGDLQTYPPWPGRKYDAPPAHIEDMQRMHRTLGIERGLIVQPTTYGTDHSLLLDLLALEKTYVGAAIIDDATTDAELRRLHEGGVRSARFNFAKFLGIAPSPATFARAIDRIAELGWVAKIHAVGSEYLDIAELLRGLRLPTVIDHLGHFYFKDGMEQPVIPVLLDLLKRENVWIMLSNADRRSATGYPWDDALPFLRRFLEAAPDRSIWGTDWPHTHYQGRMPNDADLLELLYRVAPDPETQADILVRNPDRLFGGLRG